VKVRFRHRHVTYFLENVEAMIEEQGKPSTKIKNNTEKIPGTLEYQHDGRHLLVLKKRGCW